MYLARLSQPEYLDFHLMESLATAHAQLTELTEESLKFATQGTFNPDLLNHCDVSSEKIQSSNKTSHQLVVLGEGLNLEKLNKIKLRLTDKLTIESWRIRPRVTGMGVVAKAALNLLSEENLNGLIDDIANQYRIEMALLAEPPLLAQGGLMVMDMDSTLIAVECIDEIAKLAGMGEKVASVTEQAMQ
ncbi:hypothetical protein DBR45_01900, partial [Pseudomonas sp. HMWF031]